MPVAANERQIYFAIGRKLRSARESAQLTQDQLAQRVGLTRTSITNIEQGRQKIQLHTLYAIAHALDASMDLLLPTAQPTVTESVHEELRQKLPRAAEREWAIRVLASEIS